MDHVLLQQSLISKGLNKTIPNSETKRVIENIFPILSCNSDAAASELQNNCKDMFLESSTIKSVAIKNLTSCFSSLLCSSILVNISDMFVSKTMPPIQTSAKI